MKKRISKILAMILSLAMLLSVLVPGMLFSTYAATKEETMEFTFVDAEEDGYVDNWVQAGGIHYEPADFRTNNAYYYSQNGKFQNSTNGKAWNADYTAAFAGAALVENGLKANAYPNRQIKYLDGNNDVINTGVDTWKASEYSMYTNTLFTESPALNLAQLKGKITHDSATSNFGNGSNLIVYNYADAFNWDAISIIAANGNYTLIHLGKRSVEGDGEELYYTTNGGGNSWRTDFYGNMVTTVPVITEGDISFTVNYDAQQSGKAGVSFEISANNVSATYSLADFSFGTGQAQKVYNVFNSADAPTIDTIMGNYGADATNFALGVRNVGSLTDSVVYKDISVKYVVEVTAQETADAYLTAHNEILNKTEATVAVADKAAVEAAIGAYAELSQDVKDLLVDEYALLTALQAKIEQLKVADYKNKILKGNDFTDNDFVNEVFETVTQTGETVKNAFSANNGILVPAVTNLGKATTVVKNDYASGLPLISAEVTVNNVKSGASWGDGSNGITVCYDRANNASVSYYIYNMSNESDPYLYIRRNAVGTITHSGTWNSTYVYYKDFAANSLTIRIDYDYSNADKIGITLGIYDGNTKLGELAGQTVTTAHSNAVLGFDASTAAMNYTYSNVKFNYSTADMLGSSILATTVMDDQDLRFGLSLNNVEKYLPATATVKEYGIIYMLDHWLDGKELTKDTVGKNNYRPFVSGVTVNDGDALPSVYTERVSNSMKDEFMGLKVAGRGYVVYEINGEEYTVYTEVTSKHSVVSAIKAVAQKISNNETFKTEVPSGESITFGDGGSCTVADVDTVLSGNNSYTQDERKAILLSYITKYVAYSK